MAAEQPLVIQLLEQFRRDLLALEHGQVVAMAERWLEVERALAREIELLVEEAYAAQGSGAPLPEWKVYQLDRYRALMAQVQAQISRYIDAVGPLLDGAQRAAAMQGARQAYALVSAVTDGAVRIDLSHLNQAAIENFAALARAGQPVDVLLHAAHGEAADGIVRHLIEGMGLGLNPRETARRVREEGLGRSFRHIELVARDQFNRTHREASRQQYLRSGRVPSYTRIAAKNTRTCLACLALDGKVYPTEELMELHPQDRCAMIPKVEGFPRVEFQSGEAWFQALDSQSQREMMGQVRYEAWIEGKFPFDALATRRENHIWGPSIRLTALGDLLPGR